MHNIITPGIRDFLEKYLPDYENRSDLKKGEKLCSYLAGKQSSISGLTEEEAHREIDYITIKIFHQAIEYYTNTNGLECDDCGINKQLYPNIKFCPSCGKKVEAPQYAWQCKSCGSVDVRQHAWVDPNDNYFYLGKVEDTFDGWCNNCSDVVLLEEKQINHPSADK